MTIDNTTITAPCPICKGVRNYFPVLTLEDGCLIVCSDCHVPMWHSGHITKRPVSEAEREHLARRIGLLEEP